MELMGLKHSCVALNIFYKDIDDKYQKIENIYKFIINFQSMEKLGSDLNPKNWLETYRDSGTIYENSISYKPFFYNHSDATGDYENRNVSIIVYPKFIRFWIGGDATECLDWELEMVKELLRLNLIDTALILIPPTNNIHLKRGNMIGKKNLLILYAIQDFYRGDKKDIFDFISKHKDIIYKNDKITIMKSDDLKKLLKKEKDGFFSPLIKKCFLFRGWF
jgi:hypothetical protein